MKFKISCLFLLSFLFASFCQAGINFGGGITSVEGNKINYEFNLSVIGDAGPYQVSIKRAIFDKEDEVLVGERSISANVNLQVVKSIVLTDEDDNIIEVYAEVTDRFGCKSTKSIDIIPDDKGCGIRGLGNSVGTIFPKSNDSNDGRLSFNKNELEIQQKFFDPNAFISFKWTLPDGSESESNSLFNIGPGTYTFELTTDCFVATKIIVIESCDEWAKKVVIPDPSITVICRDNSLDYIDVLRKGSFNFSSAINEGFIVSGQTSGITSSGNKLFTLTQTSNSCTATRDYYLDESLQEVIRPSGSCDLVWRCPEKGETRQRKGAITQHEECHLVKIDCSKAIPYPDDSDTRSFSQVAEMTIEEDYELAIGQCLGYRFKNKLFPDQNCNLYTAPDPRSRSPQVIYASIDCENRSYLVTQSYIYKGNNAIADRIARVNFGFLPFHLDCEVTLVEVRPEDVARDPVLSQECNSNTGEIKEVCQIDFEPYFECENRNDYSRFIVRDSKGWRRPRSEMDFEHIDDPNTIINDCGFETTFEVLNAYFALTEVGGSYATEQLIFRYFDFKNIYFIVPNGIDELSDGQKANLPSFSDRDGIEIEGVNSSCLSRSKKTTYLSSSDVNLTNSRLSNLSVYPNPTTGIFNLVLKNVAVSDIRIRLFDLSGRQIWSSYKEMATESYQIDLSNWDNGMYFGLVELLTTNQSFHFKIVKTE